MDGRVKFLKHRKDLTGTGIWGIVQHTIAIDGGSLHGFRPKAVCAFQATTDSVFRSLRFRTC